MPLYRYRAKSEPDKIIEEKIEASTREGAIKKIEEKGYFPIKVEEISSYKVRGGRIFLKKVGAKKITLFTRQLATLVRAGVPILKALSIISSQADDHLFKAIIDKIYSDIKEGQNLSAALAKYPKIFSNFYSSMIKTGETSGVLDNVLFRIADYRERQQEIVSKIKVAFVYPVVMLLVGLGTIIFMLTFVMPRLMHIFADMGSDLPLSTQILLFSSDFLKQRWPLLVVVSMALVFLYKRESQRPEVRLFLCRMRLKLPIIKRFVLRKELARFSRTLEILIKSGIPILRALGLTISTLDNEAIKKEFTKSLKDLEDGGSFGSSLRKSKIFPSFVTSLVSVGEESGKLDDALGELANTYEKELEENIKVFTTLLEPVMILTMGLLVGFIVMAMLLPIFQINIMVR